VFQIGRSTVHAAASPVDLTLGILCLKWIPAILRLLAAGDRLQAAIPGIAHKVLIDQLRELQIVGVVHRETKARRYRRVHYSLTEAGRRLLPIIDVLEGWGRVQQDVLQNAAFQHQPSAYEPRRA
jgi:DNA-binding HxlR family transcriptional regulator